MTPIPPKKYPTIATFASLTYLIKAGLIRNRSRPVSVERRARVAVPIHAKVNAPLLFHKGEGLRSDVMLIVARQLYHSPNPPTCLLLYLSASLSCLSYLHTMGEMTCAWFGKIPVVERENGDPRCIDCVTFC
jgi:hypothetical protein